MALFLDVLDASGNKLGAPITTLTGWQWVRRLDAAGTVSCSLPAADRNSALLQYKRRMRCWSMDEHGVVEHGAGIIDQITVRPQVDGPTMLEVTGDDLLRELVNRTVGDLDLIDEVITPAIYVASDATLTLPANVDLEPGPANALVIGYTETFTRVDLTLTSPYNSMAGTLKIQYYNLLSDEWVPLSSPVNTTIVDGKAFAQSGYVSFEMPAGWGMLDGKYLIRMFCEDANLTTFRLTAVKVHELLPTADALQMIMAKAPPGWSLDAAGAFATENDVYLQMQGESALAALVRLHEQTGEHFILSASGRRVRWLGSAQLSSGLRAVASSEPDDSTMVITELTRTGDTYGLYTRLYVYGGGTGIGKLTLADMDRAVPAGYAVNPSESYVECTDALAIYGQIDWRENFGDIAPADISKSAKRDAANSLFDRAYQLLRRKCQPQQAYSLSVIPSRYRLFPGQTIHVTYHEWTDDGYHAVNIDTDLVVLEIVEQIDAAQGVLIVGLTVATVDYWPTNDFRTVAQAIGTVETERNMQLPQTGLESSAVGTPTFIAIQAGSVVAVNRVIPVADGRYDSIDRLDIQGGVITAVNP